ncbi:hypothetical protein [Kitasatospora sp. CB01950]|uniref:hypothetical protein n=1 Tax=Kitasatospora sp. CB01950 TaxID=1703930 RepID=UPI00093FA08A|nr:hypothetical protein [Kitasatospora sp. CB01950]OKJ09162.1 hypothetical protein AMK19_17375 [Kitasatospora sp. CB01950]
METDGVSHGCEVLAAGPYFANLVFPALPRPVAPGGEVFADGFAFVPGGAHTLAMALCRLGRTAVRSVDFDTDLFSTDVLAAARTKGLDEQTFRHHPFPAADLADRLARTP